MDKSLITRLGDELHDALVARRTVAPLTEPYLAIRPGISLKAGDNLRVTIGGIGGCSVRFN